MAMTCGEAVMRLLGRYGLTKAFGIPGVHTLDLCRGLNLGANAGGITHIQARNEQGAGFMAEGWARCTGEVGLAIVISGPGVTNTATALGQCYGDSLPFLLISAEQPSYTIGKGWGVLHDITEQKKVTEPLTALSATAYRASDVPELLAQAFTIFASERPRPVHISIPIDVQQEMVDEEWLPVTLPTRPNAGKGLIDQAAQMLKNAKAPVMIVGGGAAEASAALTGIAEKLGAVVVSSVIGKGIVDDNHPLHLAGALSQSPAQALLTAADVVLAVGTEIAEADSYIERLDIPGDIIRIDIDPRKINDFYPAKLGIVADANMAASTLLTALKTHDGTDQRKVATKQVASARAEYMANRAPFEVQHMRALAHLRTATPADTMFCGDACQIIYTACFALPVSSPRKFTYPAGFCALGNGLPNAIGAKMARPDQPIMAIVGDGGFMFTMPEIIVAAENKMPLPILLWENGGLKQIRDDMDLRDISRVGVEGINPDFEMLAKACHCHAVRPQNGQAFEDAIKTAFQADRPTLIILRENDPWLVE
ncbi:hypothetical protein RB2150_06943 [Rhodobacterales bacterium HTCC2150]|nr:hypothetical protein RB2150_06943 [Rhodobacterales bacterium HTCC2150] [Rhodobacteraceae bacterium HTCC2150]